MPLALTFLAAMVALLQWAELQDAADESPTLIADMPTLQRRIATWMRGEQAAVQALAGQLTPQPEPVLSAQVAVIPVCNVGDAVQGGRVRWRTDAVRRAVYKRA